MSLARGGSREGTNSEQISTARKLNRIDRKA